MGDNGKRHYIVDAEFQGRFILKFVVAMVLSMSASIVGFNYLAVKALEGLKWRMVIHEQSVAEIVMPYMYYISVFSAALAVFLLSAASRLLRKEMVGVIYRLNKDMEEVSRGNYRLRIGLRRADPFKDTAVELDSVVTSLREKLRKTNEIFENTKRIIGSIEEVKEAYLPAKCARLVRSAEALEKSLT